jgi:hypothetical protein
VREDGKMRYQTTTISFYAAFAGNVKLTAKEGERSHKIQETKWFSSSEKKFQKTKQRR